MCGPLTCMFFEKENAKKSIFIYHFSRLLSYLLIVFTLTIIGALTVKNMMWNRFSDFILWVTIAFVSLQLIKFIVSKKIKTVFPKITCSKNFPLGMGLITGLLPCGLLIPAYIGAASLPSRGMALVAVFFFFAGTLPALLMSQTLIHQVKRKLPAAVYPWFNTGLGVIFLVVQIIMLKRSMS